jgi:mono/diheme cytochrome c family protein
MRKGAFAVGLLWMAFLLIGGSCGEDGFRSGRRIYQLKCANCHMDNGEGLAGLIPPLASSDYLATNRERLPCVVEYGLADTIYVNGMRYDERMQGIKGLNDIQICNLLNYIGQNWGNSVRTFDPKEVSVLLSGCDTLSIHDTKSTQ